MEKLYDWNTIHIPEACKGVDIVIGVDEAGRGPVLGSLVYAAAFWPVSESSEIEKMGFDDSKQLKEGERDRLLSQLISHPSIGWVIEEISAETISEVQSSTVHPLNDAYFTNH
jgi:ribonuclease H2 subunit A